MAYGERLKNPGAKDFPEGRQSYQGSIKQVKGNLKWSLKFLSPEEIIELLAEVNPTPNDIEELNYLIAYHRFHKERLQKKLELLSSDKLETNGTDAKVEDGDKDGK